jgi:hypothetical protein
MGWAVLGLPSVGICLAVIIGTIRRFLLGVSDGQNIPHTASFWSDQFRVSPHWPSAVADPVGKRHPRYPAIGANRLSSGNLYPLKLIQLYRITGMRCGMLSLARSVLRRSF